MAVVGFEFCTLTMRTEHGVVWRLPVKGTAVDGLLTILAGAGVGTPGRPMRPTPPSELNTIAESEEG